MKSSLNGLGPRVSRASRDHTRMDGQQPTTTPNWDLQTDSSQTLKRMTTEIANCPKDCPRMTKAKCTLSQQ